MSSSTRLRPAAVALPDPGSAAASCAARSQAVFAAALVDPDRPVPDGLRAWNGSDPGHRFGIYRNNVVASLTAALADTFDVVRQIVGDAFFVTLARHFIAAHPPQSPVLAKYGGELPDFLSRYAPARSLPCLADLARLEFARVRAFHAADATTLPAASAAARLDDPAALAGSTLELHPSLTVLGSQHPVASLWAAHQGLGDVEAVDLRCAEAVLVLRADDDAAVVPVPLATATFVAHLQRGVTLGAAAAAAGSSAADGQPFDLAAALTVLLTQPLILAWQVPGDGTPTA